MQFLRQVGGLQAGNNLFDFGDDRDSYRFLLQLFARFCHYNSWRNCFWNYTLLLQKNSSRCCATAAKASLLCHRRKGTTLMQAWLMLVTSTGDRVCVWEFKKFFLCTSGQLLYLEVRALSMLQMHHRMMQKSSTVVFHFSEFVMECRFTLLCYT